MKQSILRTGGLSGLLDDSGGGSIKSIIRRCYLGIIRLDKNAACHLCRLLDDARCREIKTDLLWRWPDNADLRPCKIIAAHISDRSSTARRENQRDDHTQREANYQN